MSIIAANEAKNNPIPQYRGIIDALSKMQKAEGFRTLYRGVFMNVVAGSIANSVFFYVYTDGKKRYAYDPKRPYSLTTVLISMRAGLASMFVTSPMWTVKTRVILCKEYSGISVSFTPCSLSQYYLDQPKLIFFL
jgi:hypothetical protein